MVFTKLDKIWFDKQMKKLMIREYKNNNYFGIQDPIIYKKGNKLRIITIEEDESPDTYYMIKGKIGESKLQVNKIIIKNHKVDEYMKSKYKGYKNRNDLQNEIIEIMLNASENIL